MTPKILNSIANISRRFRDYDSAGTKYAFDILYTTVHSSGEYVKVKRQHGADIFDRNIKELSEDYDDVATIIVSDYCGKAGNAHRINPPVIIELTDASTDGQSSERKEADFGQGKPNHGVLHELSGFLAGIEYAGAVWLPLSNSLMTGM